VADDPEIIAMTEALVDFEGRYFRAQASVQRVRDDSWSGDVVKVEVKSRW
jgi:hypothetical protein